MLENFKDGWNPLRSICRRWPEYGMVLRFFAGFVKNRAMFFLLSKTLNIFLEPLSHPFLLLALALIFSWRKRRRLAKLLTMAAVAVPLLYGFLPLSTIALRHLESQFPIPTMATMPDIDGIIVLGGHTGNALISETRNQPQQSSGAERFTHGLALHQQYPDSILLFSGFSGQLNPVGWSEAKTIRALLDLLQVAPDNILFEDTSRNTYENAKNSFDILVPQPGSHWLLVTSANHMPRAVGAFRKIGWTGLIPYPVDYQTATTPKVVYSLIDGIKIMRKTFHEYAGLVMYKVTGRSSNLLPTTMNRP